MKNYYFILLVCYLGINFSGCQKNEEPSGTPPQETLGNSPEELLFKGYNLLNLGHKAFYEFADKNNGNASLALYETGKLIFDTGIPQDVYIEDSIYMYIVMNADITLLLRMDYIGEDGKSFFRGGPNGGNSLKKLLNDASCSNTIPNNKILLWGAANNLNFDYPYVKTVLSLVDLEFEVTELMHTECTPETLKTLDQYGLVLLDTHGATNAIMTGSVIDFDVDKPKNFKDFKKKMLSYFSQEEYDDFLKGDLIIGETLYNGERLEPEMGGEDWWKDKERTNPNEKYEVWANLDYLEKLPNLSNTIVFNNSCYSGATVKEMIHGNINGDPVNLVITETVANAFLGRNPIAYYGWTYDDLLAGPVSDNIAIEAENNFIQRLAYSADSTGRAYLKPDGGYFEFTNPPKYPKKLTFRHFNNDSYCYQDPCEETFTDPRDEQEYKIVCIGEQVWMAENLNFNSDESWCWNDKPNNCETYGRLYTSESVKTACPPGWHLPSIEEYEELRDNFPPYMAGGELKSVTGWEEPNTGATNNSGWSALPGGRRNLKPEIHLSLGQFGYWWTSTTLFSNDADRTRYVRLSYNKIVFGISSSGPVDGSVAYSCRCVKDKVQ